MTPLRVSIAAVVALGTLEIATPAQAKTHKEASYAYEQVWPAAVRFLRIDENVTIVEKDADTGYVLFDFQDDRKTFRGALEVVRIRDRSGRKAVRLVLRINDRPGYVESLLLKKLVRKLIDELGHPAPPPRKKKPAPDKPDEGDEPAKDGPTAKPKK